jgi:hypothetical protein
MTRIIEKFGRLLLGPELITGENSDTLELRQLEVTFITSQKQILKHIRLCKQSGGLIGIYSKSLGKGMFLTTVEDMEEKDSDVSLVLKPIDMSGEKLTRSVLSLKEISAICPFNQMYYEPRAHEGELKLVH